MIVALRSMRDTNKSALVTLGTAVIAAFLALPKLGYVFPMDNRDNIVISRDPEWSSDER